MKKYIFYILIIGLGLNTNAQDIIFSNVNYVDVESGEIQTGNVVIRDNKIHNITAGFPQKQDCIIVEGNGKYLIPGLFDSHIHLFQSGGLYTRPDVVDLRFWKPYEEEIEWLNSNADDLLKRYMSLGITSVVDVGGPLRNFRIRDKFLYSNLHPTLYLTGPLVSTYQPEEFRIPDPPIVKVNSSEEARQLVQSQLKYHPDFIKIWYITLPSQSAESTIDIIRATIDESHRNDLPVAVHATELNTAKLAVHAGADILVHSVGDSVDSDFINMVRDSGVFYIPTLMVGRKYTQTLFNAHSPTKIDLSHAHPVPFGSVQEVPHIDHPYLNRLDDFKEKSLSNRRQTEKIGGQNLLRMQEAGILVATGTDAGNIGTQHASSYFEEIQMMNEAGLNPAEILKASTITAARCMGVQDKIGSIEKNKIADLVLSNSNPLENVENWFDIDLVMKNGHLIDPDTLVKITPEILAQQQLNAYNNRDIDAFLKPYSDSVRIYNFPNSLVYSGKEQMREVYSSMFESTPNLHCYLENRIIMGNTVIDHERVQGFSESEIQATAIYKIKNNKIQEVFFLRGN